jgi:hypothetical protein
MLEQVVAAVVAAEAARTRRNEIVHQDWLLRGRDAMRSVSELARITSEDLPAYLEEWERESRTSKDWQGAVPERRRRPRTDLGRAPRGREGTRISDKPCVRRYFPGRELPRDRQPARIRPPGLNALTRPA